VAITSCREDEDDGEEEESEMHVTTHTPIEQPRYNLRTRKRKHDLFLACATFRDAFDAGRRELEGSHLKAH